MRLLHKKDAIKCPDIWKIDILEGEETNEGIDNLFHEILEENFPNLERQSKIQTQEIQKTPNRYQHKKIFSKAHHSQIDQNHRQKTRY